MNASTLWSGRLALFIIYAWFGALKVLGYSPAEGLVMEVFQALFPWGEVVHFVEIFGVFEVGLGVAFLLYGPRPWIIRLFVAHMLATFLPLIALPASSWQAPFVPTLLGQYIMKNIALLSLVKFMRADDRVLTTR